MPVRNGEKFLDQAKKGLFSNCGEFDEILIINDGSTDSTNLILDSWRDENPNIRIISNSKSSGLVSALNLGISESTHKWIARFDVDDVYAIDRIDHARKALSKNLVAVFSDYSFLSEKNNNLGYMPSAIFKNQTYLSLVTSQRTAHPSVIFNKDAVIEVDKYLLDDYPAEDISLWLRLSNIGSLETIPSEDLKYRISGNSITSRSRAKAIKIKDKLIFDFEFQQEIIKECIDSLEDTFEKYKEHSYSSERYLLHLRDLLILENLGKIKLNTNFKKRFFMNVVSHPKIIYSGLNISVDVMKRKFYRSKIYKEGLL